MAKQPNPSEVKPQQPAAQPPVQSKDGSTITVNIPKPVKKEEKVDTAAMDSATALRLMEKLEAAASGSGISLEHGPITTQH